MNALTDRQAKPALPFGGKFRLVDFPLSNCINSGIRQIGVVTQYRAHTLLHHVQRAWSFLPREMSEFVELWPAQQQKSHKNWYVGTADSVFQNIERIREHRPQYVLILAGDHVYKQDYAGLIAEHAARGVVYGGAARRG
jgi:glucose-1-phosphate adenylyltransferase